MDGRAFLGVAVAFAATAGALSGCLGSGAGAAPAEVVVPFPRLGDEAVFDALDLDNGTGNVRRTFGALRIQVEAATTRVRDAYDIERETYVLREIRPQPRWDDPSVVEEAQEVFFVDVRTNLMVRVQSHREGNGAWTSPGLASSADHRVYRQEESTWLEPARPTAHGGFFQGETIRLAPGRTYRLEADDFTEIPRRWAEALGSSPAALAWGVEAGRAALVEGRPALGVTTTRTRALDVAETGMGAEDDGAGPASGLYRETRNQTTWFSGDVPFPVLFEHSNVWTGPHGTGSNVGQLALASYVRGTAPAVTPAALEAGPPRHEGHDWRPPVGRRPADGGLPFAWSLAEAEGAVRSDRRLAGFHEFLAASPGAFLETFYYTEADGDAFRDSTGRGEATDLLAGASAPTSYDRSLNWVMIFARDAEPESERRLVASRFYTRSDGQPLVRNVDLGDTYYHCGRMGPEGCARSFEVPATTPTLESLHRVAAEAMGGGAAPNFLYWGLDYGAIEHGEAAVSGDRGGEWNDDLSLPDDVDRYRSGPERGPYVAIVARFDGSVPRLTPTTQESGSVHYSGAVAWMDPYDGALRYLQDAEVTTETTERPRVPLSLARTEEGHEFVRGAPLDASVGQRDGVRPVPLVVGGATSLGLAAFLLLYFWPWLKAVATSAGVPLYAKIRRARVLDHRHREAIADLLRAEPGLHPQEIRRRMGLGWTTVIHHLRTLQRHRLVSSLREGRYLRFFPAADVSASERMTLALERNPYTSRVAGLIRARPGISHRELAAAAGLDPSTVSWHVARMRRADMVRVERMRRQHFYYLTEHDGT